MFVLGGLVCATWLSAQDYQKTAYGIKAAAGGVDVEVQFFTPSVVRVVKSPQGEHFEKKSLAVVASPGEVGVKVGIKDGAIVMDTKVLQVNLDTSTGAFSYRTADGKLLLAEKPVEKSFVPFDDAGDATYNVYQAFKLDADEAIYGLGQLQNGKMSQRGVRKNMIQGNVEDVSPFFQSTKGYGLYWDNYSPTLFTDNEEETSFRSDVGDCMDYYFMYGGDADGVVAQVR